jgi:hypothetical protein
MVYSLINIHDPLLAACSVRTAATQNLLHHELSCEFKTPKKANNVHV